jgi:hypothetical protein
MSTKELERAGYFEGQLLRASDFQVDQSYFESLSAARNRAVHSAGIVDGLELGAGPQRTSIVVSPGIAVDALGRTLVLAEATSAQVIEGSSTAFYVLLTASERPRAATSASGALGYERYDLEPRVEISADGVAQGASQVVLGRLLIDASGAIRSIDLRVRVYTGTSVGQATFVSGDHTGDERPSISAAQVDPAGAVLTIGAARTTFFGSLEIAGTLGINVDFPHAQLEIWSDRDPVVALRTEAGSSAFVLTREGDVGVGTATPRARLEVAGDVLLDDGASIRFALDQSTIGVQGPGPKITFSSSGTTLSAPSQINLGAGTTTPMVLDSTGQVTIGDVVKPAPATLSVDGRIRTLAGGLRFPDGVLQTTATLSTTIPIGAVIDWYLPDDVVADWFKLKGVLLALPPEFQICDGKPVASGPFKGNNVPDLQALFVRGTTQYGLVGLPSGAPQHLHQITEVPTHTHPIDHDHPAYNTVSGPGTNSDSGAKGNEDELADSDHQHQMTIIIALTTGESGESSPVTSAATLDAVNLPPYYSLVKVIRIL